jgi:hypothetical protein
VAAVNPGTGFVFDAATFVWSIAFLTRMRPRPFQPAQRQRFVRDLADGFHEVRSRTWVWVSILAVGLTVMIQIAPIDVLGPVIARRHFGGAAAWAAIEAAFGAGTVLGGTTAMRAKLNRPLRFVNFCYLLSLPASVALAIRAPLAAIVLAQLMSGWSVGLYVPVWDTLLQERIPPNVLSRVSAYDWMGAIVFMPLGLAAAGPVAGAIGIRTTLICGAVWAAITVVATLSVREIWTLERRLTPADSAQ